MGLFNNKPSDGDAMGMDIVYSLIRGGCLAFFIVGGFIALFYWTGHKLFPTTHVGWILAGSLVITLGLALLASWIMDIME